jgi:hypothetical protein
VFVCGGGGRPPQSHTSRGGAAHKTRSRAPKAAASRAYIFFFSNINFKALLFSVGNDYCVRLQQPADAFFSYFFDGQKYKLLNVQCVCTV